MASSQSNSDIKPTRFIPLMVQFITPLSLVLMIIAVVGVFLLSNSLGGNVEAVEENLLVQSSLQIAESMIGEYDSLLQEAQRIAYTQGVAEALTTSDAQTLQNIIEPIAQVTALDSVIAVDIDGQEIVGLLHNEQADDFSLSQGTVLEDEHIVQDILNIADNNAVAIVQTPNGSALYVAVPIRQNESVAGALLTGRYVSTVLNRLQENTLADVTLYLADGSLVDTSIEIENINRAVLETNQTIIDQTLSNFNQVTLGGTLEFNGHAYRVAYIPLSLGETTLGVLSVSLPDNVAFATAGGRQFSALLMAILAGAVTFVAVVTVNVFTRRLERVTDTVTALAHGEQVRVDMKATDEIGQIATAVNQYADVILEREDHFRSTLRRHRRERDYLLLAFSAIPEGIIVQDMEGRVVLMNEPARDLMGSERVFRSAGLHELTSVVNTSLGNLIAPGLYALGNPQHIQLDEKMLLAQASAIVLGNGLRLGSVVLLRDITEDVRREQAREQIMAQIADDIQLALQDTSRRSMQNDDAIVRRLARDVAKHASALQSMIVEMRELTQYSSQKVQQMQRPLSLETLVWAVANDWRQIARANDIQLNVILEARGLFVLGDEQRLRYAVGNLVDNAIKYTPAGGKLSIEVRGEAQGLAQLRVRDNGVGIADTDLPQVFIRYYRGQPKADDGEMIHVPGMGQGLSNSQQIVTAHGGKIRIRSKLTMGTAVYVALPTTASQAYQLPLIEDDDVMEGETMLIPDHVTADTFWGGKDEL